MCTSYLLEDVEYNKAVVEVTLVPGYIPVALDLERSIRYDWISRHKVNGNEVLFFVEQLTKREKCLEFRVSMGSTVATVQPGTVKVYGYSTPSLFISEVIVFAG